MTSGPPPRTAHDVTVVIPCLDEAPTIATVVRSFAAALPGARILVVDNGSQDDTARRAREAGADVIVETRRGKGYAVLRGFAEARASAWLLMVDGDGTYDATAAPALLEAARSGADMVIGTRLQSSEAGAFPTAHGFGNRAFIVLTRVLFGARTTDLFSGYRVLSRRLVDGVPLIAQGFEIETELSLQAIIGGYRVAEIPTMYSVRHADSSSKLRTFRDGYRIMLVLLAFFRDYRPLTCFGAIAIVLAVIGLAIGSIPVLEFMETGRIARFPSAILATGLILLSAISLVCGIVLTSINRRALEMAARFTTLTARNDAGGRSEEA